jgi:Ca2+ transporting ATPase
VTWADGKYDNTGNDTECAMLVLATNLLAQQGNKDKLAYRVIRKKFPMDDPSRAAISFSSQRKRMSTLVKMPEGQLRLFCKGASEIVLGFCTQVVRPDGQPQALTAPMRQALETTIGSFADEGLRTIAVAYRDCDTAPNMEDGDSAEQDLILIALLGLEDPVRPEVPGAVQICKNAGIVVRMVTGDNPRTAVAIAKKCGILNENDSSAIVMTGAEFRERVVDENDEINQEEFDKIWINLRVLARSSPIDKLTLVTGIQNSRASTPQVVAVTGDGTNDAPALKRADIGFAMKSGTQVAWKASDIVILDDNFKSVVEAVKWGRCVYDNICKFLQFQLTVIMCVGVGVGVGVDVYVYVYVYVCTCTDIYYLYVVLYMYTYIHTYCAGEFDGMRDSCVGSFHPHKEPPQCYPAPVG